MVNLDDPQDEGALRRSLLNFPSVAGFLMLLEWAKKKDMKNHWTLFVGLILIACSSQAAEKRALLREYTGDVVVPDELYAAYAKLVDAFRAGDQTAIKSLCLPHAVPITTAVRNPDQAAYGVDLNLPYVRTSFTSEILGVRQDAKGVLLLRTGTSYLFFVKTEALGWRLYRYGDKPIE